MEIEKIKEIFEAIKDTDIVEVEIEKEGIRIRIKRGFTQQLTTPTLQETPLIKNLPQENQKYSKIKESKNLITIRSPMVGTFYRAPSPQAPPFVEEGDIISKGQVLCIIEAMKLMNEIESDVDGKIVSILVEDGKPVEYGEPLFLIEPLQK